MRNKFHQVVLHGETLVFFATAIVATVAKVVSGSFKKPYKADFNNNSRTLDLPNAL